MFEEYNLQEQIKIQSSSNRSQIRTNHTERLLIPKIYLISRQTVPSQVSSSKVSLEEGLRHSRPNRRILRIWLIIVAQTLQPCRSSYLQCFGQTSRLLQDAACIGIRRLRPSCIPFNETQLGSPLTKLCGFATALQCCFWPSWQVVSATKMQD